MIEKCCKCGIILNLSDRVPMTLDKNMYKEDLKNNLCCCLNCFSIWKNNFVPIIRADRDWVNIVGHISYDLWDKLFFEDFLNRKFIEKPIRFIFR